MNYLTRLLNTLKLFLVPLGLVFIFAGVGTIEGSGDYLIGILLSIAGLLTVLLGGMVYNKDLER